MPLITITCPHCSFSREIDDNAIPVGVTSATCPKCRQKFTLIEAVTVVPLPGAQPSASPPPPVSPRDADTGFSGTSSHSPPQQHLRFSFTGKAGEYFGIWIVNTLLKIITIGMYSAWAKVRKRRYFYGNTFLNKIPFDYLADPNILFRGWLIAAVFFLLYSVANKVSPLLTTLLGILFYLGVPWLIVRSRSFNLRNSDHRNIRFTFNPDYRGAYLVFAGLPLLLPVTLGLIFPYMIYCQKKFFVENSGYGRTRFTFDASAKDFYLLFLKASGWFILLVGAVISVLGLFSAALSEFLPLFRDIGEINSNASAKAIGVVLVLMFLSFNLLYLYFAIYLRTCLANLTWNATRIRKSSFISTLRVRDMAWLYLSSAIAIFCSFGLLIPWASIRIARYKMEHLALDLTDDAEGFLGWGHSGISPAGEEIGDMFGIDIGL